MLTGRGEGAAALLSTLPLMDDPPLRRRNRRLLSATTTWAAAAAAAAEVMAGELTDAAQRGRELDLSDFTTVRRLGAFLLRKNTAVRNARLDNPNPSVGVVRGSLPNAVLWA
jgi:hypothetical protein